MSSKYAFIVVRSVCVYAQSCPILCDPMDYNLPGSSVLGIFQARILEWAAISYSRESSQSRDQTTSLMSPALQVDSLPLSHLGSPNNEQKTMIQHNWDNIIEENVKLF